MRGRLSGRVHPQGLTPMQLPPHLSFCRVQDRLVFLDIEQDRYFALGGDLTQAFEALLDGSADSDARGVLEQCGLVVPGAGKTIEPCAASIPKASWLDHLPPSASPARVLGLAWAFARMHARLRRHGLARPAAQLAALRENAAPRANDDQLAAAVGAYDRLCLLRGTHDLCLPHSLALATSLARCGYAAEVVLGVQMRPFGAHCWVEYRDQLVSDRYDRVRSYTPIRRL